MTICHLSEGTITRNFQWEQHPGLGNWKSCVQKAEVYYTQHPSRAIPQWMCTACSMRSLHLLDYHPSLRTLPPFMSEMAHLEVIHCPFLDLEDLPDSIGTLQSLRVLSCPRAIFRELPICIESLHPDCTIVLQIAEQNNEQRPDFYPETALFEQLCWWIETMASQTRGFVTIHSPRFYEPLYTEGSSMQRWLNKCSRNTKTPGIAAQVIQILNYAVENSEYRGIFFQCIEEQGTDCEDRSLVILQNLQIEMELSQNLSCSLKDLQTFLIGVHRLNLLKGWVSKSYPDRENLETFLDAQMLLQQSLQLPYPVREITFQSVSYLRNHQGELKEEGLNHLYLWKDSIFSQSLSPSNVCDILITYPQWQEKIKETYPTHFQGIDQKYYNRQQAIDETTDSAYVQKSNCCRDEREQEILDLVRTLTLQLVEEEVV